MVDGLEPGDEQAAGAPSFWPAGSVRVRNQAEERQAVKDVSATRKGRDDIEASMRTLVSAFLAVAEDLVAEDPDRAKEEGPGYLLAVGPSDGVVARSNESQQGLGGPESGRDQSEPSGRTKRRSA
jgi:hypothetical protein